MTHFALGSFGSITMRDDSPSSWYAPSSREMSMLDERAISGGIPSLELMERAGAAVAEFIRGLTPLQRSEKASVLIACGPGNNGGDGIVIARRLADAGIPALAVLTDASRYSPEVLAQLAKYPHVVALEGSGEVARSACAGRLLSADEFAKQLQGSALIVDALLGTGQRDAPRGSVATFVEAIAAEKARRPDVVIVSVDIPTGVDADTGALSTPHIVADHTVSIELIKRGMLQFPGRSACGAIHLVSIGIGGRDGVGFSMMEGTVLPRLKRRTSDAHKGMQGRVLVIAGSAAMPGASALAVLGALRSGSGLVSRATKPSWIGVEVAPECMNVVIETPQSHYIEDDCAYLVDAIAAADAVVLGPGLGREPETARFVEGCLNSFRLLKKRCVIDADALALIAEHGLELRGINGVITPHPGEAAAMLSLSTAEIQRDRFAAVEALYNRYGIVSLLKGAGTLVWDGARGGIIARGTPYLATAGSGDVLSGIIAMCLTRCESVFDATVCGAYIHAVGGERASSSSGGPILASDVAYSAASVVGELER